MPFVNNKGVRIYYEVEGQGPPLVLAHGRGGTLDTWRRNGYADALKNDFTLALFDARGHGQSDKPHETPAYEFNLIVDDVVAVLDALGIGKAHYFGYSMGAMTGFRVAIRSAARFHSFILGGGSPYRSSGVVKGLQDLLEIYKTLLTDPQAYLVLREEARGHVLTNEETNEGLANDAEAHIASTTASLNWPPLTNDELSHISVPCLLYCGDLDPRHPGAKEGAKRMPQATFVSLPGLDHVPAFVRSDMALPHVKKFLAEVSKP